MTAIEHAHSSPRIINMAAELLAGVASPPGTLIDLPCGTGDFSRIAVERGWDVIPCDLEPENWRGPASLAPRHVDMNAELPLDADSADAIVCCEGIEHIENPWLVLREFRRILRPGGALILTLPNTIDLRQRFRVLRRGYLGHYMPKVPYHINVMGPFILCHGLIEHGFTVRAATSPKRYGGLFSNLMARMVGFDRRAGLPDDVRAMLSSQDVLRGRTVGIAATLDAAVPESHR